MDHLYHRRTLIGLMLLLVLFLISCNMGPYEISYSKVSKYLDVDITSGVVEVEVETHGGFLGDGETYLQLYFSEEEAQALVSEILDSTYWKPLPMSDTLKNATHDLIGNEDLGIPELPDIGDGYYFFENRKTGVESDNEEEIFDGYSWNFTVCIYDNYKQTMYFFAFDT